MKASRCAGQISSYKAQRTPAADQQECGAAFATPSGVSNSIVKMHRRMVPFPLLLPQFLDETIPTTPADEREDAPGRAIPRLSAAYPLCTS